MRTKVQDVKQAEFFFLDLFYTYKNAVFFIRLCAFCTFYVKQTTFFLFDVFYAYKIVVYFIRFCAFCACKIKNSPNTLIYYTTFKVSI